MMVWRPAVVAVSALVSGVGLWRLTHARAAVRGALVAVLAFWALAAGSAVAMAPDRKAAVVESLIYLALLLILTSYPTLVACVRTAPRPVAWGSALVWALSLHVQVRDVSTPYPFVPWTMFGDGSDFATLSFYEYVGVHVDGSEERLAPAKLVPSLGADRLRTVLDELAMHAIRTDASTPSAGAVTQFNAMLQALSRLYNSDHPDHPIERLEVYARRLDVPKNRRPGIPSTLKVWSVKVE